MRRTEGLIWLAAVAALIVAPWFMRSGVTQNLAMLAPLFAVVAPNWDLTLGYAGIFNFAHVAFFGIAAYVAAIHLGVPIWLDIVLAVLVVAVLAGVTAALALRLRGIYVALVTFAFVQLCVALIISQRQITGGAVGLVGVPDLQAFGFQFGADPRAYVYLSGSVLLASTLFLRWLVRSDFGLSLVALRDNEATQSVVASLRHANGRWRWSRALFSRRSRVRSTLTTLLSLHPTSSRSR